MTTDPPAKAPHRLGRNVIVLAAVSFLTDASQAPPGNSHVAVMARGHAMAALGVPDLRETLGAFIARNTQ